MRRGLVLLFSCMLNTGSMAADWPQLAANRGSSHSWTGLYAGANAGFGWTSGDGAHRCFDPDGLLNGPTCQSLPASADPLSTGDGGLFGAQVGVNWQRDRVVFGAEADGHKSFLKSSHTVVGPFPFVDPLYGFADPPGVYAPSVRIDWLATARLRVGYTITDRTLLFVTGGLAFGGVKASTLLTAPNVGTTYAGATARNKLGLTFGAGLEHALDTRWSVKLEALYYKLGEIEAVGRETPLLYAPAGYRHNSRFDMHGGIARLGLNYKL